MLLPTPKKMIIFPPPTTTLALALILLLMRFYFIVSQYEKPASLRKIENCETVTADTSSHQGMVVVLDTYAGLCNQMGDIDDGINFCLYYNLTFTVRNAAFRNPDLSSWYPVSFTKLFDDSFLVDIPGYVNYSSISHLMTEENTVNFDGQVSAHHLFNKSMPLVPQMKAFKKTFVVLTQCFMVCRSPVRSKNFYHVIGPSTVLLNEYRHIRNHLLVPNEDYNFLHYRYEPDFVDHFKVSMKSLETVIKSAQYHDGHLKLYVATTDIHRLIDVSLFNGSVVFKNESSLTHLNFEQKAMIDFLFGIHAKEVVGFQFLTCFKQFSQH